MSEKIKQKVSDKPEVLHVVTAKDLSVSKAEKQDISAVAFSQYITTLKQNWRQGTVGVQGRADVSLSGKKPWKQKGTGRARAGTARSPLWRGGGVIHGPQERSRTLKISKKVKRKVLNSLFWDCLDRGTIVRFDVVGLSDKPKTAVAYKALKDFGLHNKKVLLFTQQDDVLHQASFANLKNVRTLFFDQANAYDLASSDTWVILKKDFNVFKEMVKTWLSN